MRYLYISLLVIASLPSIVKGQIITTVAGKDSAGFSGDGGQATNAELNKPSGITTDVLGNLYIADYANNRIRKINSLGNITTIAGTGTAGFSGDGGQATSAKLSSPISVILDAEGNLYIADESNNRIRKVNTSGIITTVVGNGAGAGSFTCCYGGDGGQATNAELNEPSDLAFDSQGNLYISDWLNNCIRKVSTNGIISTVAGNGTSNGGFSGDGGQATAAKLFEPSAITIDVLNNLYIVDEANNRVRKINSQGIISTIAGNGTAGYSGDGGQAAIAELNSPLVITSDTYGNLYVADGDRIRKIDNLGIINTIAGNGTQGFSGDGWQATSAEFYGPSGLCFDDTGNLFISDFSNNRIRKVTNVAAAGIEQFAANNEQVMVYPNPASTSLTLTLSKGEGTYSINIYDMLGKLVMQHTYSPPSEGQGEAIDVSDLSEGVYNICISGNETIINKRVIIVR